MPLLFSRYFRMIVLYSLILGTLPVILLGFFSYYKASSVVLDKVHAANKHALEQAHLRIEQELMALDNLAMQYLSTVLVKGAMTQSLGIRDFERVRNMMSSQFGMKTYGLNVTNVELVNFTNNWVIDGDGLHEIGQGDSHNKYESYLKVEGNSFWVYEESEQNNYVSLVKKFPLVSTAPTGLLIIQTPNYYINNFDLLPADMLGRMMIVDERGVVLADRESERIGTSLAELPYIVELKHQQNMDGYFPGKDRDDNKIDVLYRKSDYNGWTYLYLVSPEEVVKDARSIGWLTLAICLGLFAIMSVIAILGSNRIYSPVRKLYRSALGEGPRPKSNAIEFQRIADRIDSLIMSNSEMDGKIKHQVGQLKHLFIFKLLQGAVSETEAVERAQQYQLVPDHEQLFCLIVVQLDSLDETRYRGQDLDLLIYAVNNIIEEMISPDNRMFAVPYGAIQATAICSVEENAPVFLRHVYDEARNIQDTVKQVLQLPVSIGISRPYQRMVLTSQAYEEATEALKFRIRLGRELIVSIEDVAPGAASHPLYPVASASELGDAIRTSDPVEASRLLDRFIEEVRQQDLNPREYQMLFVRLLMDIVRLAEGVGEPLEMMRDDGSDGNVSFARLYELYSMEELKQWLLVSVIMPLIQRIEGQRNAHYRQISSDMVDMIHKHYDTDLTLDVCADALNYHPNYIKRVFSKGTGTSFSDYLLTYRMKKAKLWLAESEMTIAEIADKLRYRNSQNFIRQFRKMEGITPGQFRKAAESVNPSKTN
ncbi:helix-turn-helix domain-containing protein [Paenibacillus nasutitermitis]|uniref:HTH-type transcriptional regulator YtdP n=1 Tax=Paenibacillus nasutitermitis TaxID=1652958 RepID=A0A917DL93_9BACL|nr:helix-turn-helix domain-containing protein [Paenibacillus nasutitermitis]GGD46996.1 putative HTH-type transcriptional regulator YtdP [Paenibacillus nasutitermitis]